MLGKGRKEFSWNGGLQKEICRAAI